MRDHSHRDRLLKLPYSMGCATESSVAVGKKYQPKKQQKQQYPAKHVPLPPPTRKIEEKERWSIVKMRNIKSFKRFPNFGMGKAMNKMIKSFKRFPQLFVYKEEDEEEEEEKEMEIGLPTDVKHVTHIGWDGSTTINNPMTGWENLQATEILSLSSITLRQFELAMNAQTGNESSCVSGTKMAQKIIS